MIVGENTPGGGDSYSANAIIETVDPTVNKRLLIQADISYNSARVNIHQWWIDLPE
jgi:hypothetical protein